MSINYETLGRFLKETHRATYANKGAEKVESLRPGSQDYHFEQGEFTYHDTYFGGRDFMGEEIVYQEGKSVWGMNYHGYVLKDEISTADATKILRPALMQDVGEMLPVRGPREHIEGESRYVNKQEGTLERFFGIEEIFISDKPVYRCLYHGGTIQP